ncbi:MAG: Ig-like domain-containing protein, partial [Planctomycetota bacterium]
MQVVDPNGAVILDVTSSDTSTVYFESLPIVTSGNHNILVESSTVAAGDYEATFLLNSTFDSELLSGGAANDSLATSQSLAAHALSLGTTSSQAGIVGRLVDGDSEDWFAVDLDDGQFATVVANSDDPNHELALELYDDTGTLLASGMQSGNATAVISTFLDKTSDAQSDVYHVRVTGAADSYQLMALVDSDFDSELPSGLQDWTAPNLLGFITSTFNGLAEPDDASEGSVISDSFANVTLSDVYGDEVIAQATLQATTGLLVFAPNASIAEWKSGEHELRAEFDKPVDFAAIDVITNDASDVAVLKAYDSNQNLLETIYSNVALSGAPVSLEITRAAGDISSIVVTGVGNDSVMLDNLEFGLTDGTDAFTIEVQANDIIDITASAPVGGPYQFNGELFEPGNESIGLRLFDPAGTLLTSGTTTLNHTATQAGSYEVQVFSNDRPGEYLLEFGGLMPTINPSTVVSATPTDGSPLGQFPSTITLTFSEAVDLSTVDAADFQINGMSAQSVSSSGNEVTIVVDPASEVAGAQQTLDVAAGGILDLQGLGNDAFTDTFIVRTIEPFEPLGPEGALSYISTTDSTLSSGGNLKRFSFFAHEGESLSAIITPSGSARLTAEFVGLSSQQAATSNGEILFIDSIES